MARAWAGRIPLRRVVTRLGVALAVAWIAALVVIIRSQPPPGESDPASLARAVEAAFRDGDPGELERLLAGEPPRDAVARLRSVCGGAVTAARARGTEGIELLTHGGRVCGTLPIDTDNGRWYVDPWAAPLR